jgi:magnesium transporter
VHRVVKQRSRKAGLPPGTPVHIGERRSETTRSRLMHYIAAQVTERETTTVDECAALRGAGMTWVHVTGVHDVALLSQLGGCFGLHPLVLEDIADTDQRPSSKTTAITSTSFCACCTTAPKGARRRRNK